MTSSGIFQPEPDFERYLEMPDGAVLKAVMRQSVHDVPPPFQ